jgi:hypothetical protein
MSSSRVQRRRSDNPDVSTKPGADRYPRQRGPHLTDARRGCGGELNGFTAQSGHGSHAGLPVRSGAAAPHRPITRRTSRDGWFGDTHVVIARASTEAPSGQRGTRRTRLARSCGGHEQDGDDPAQEDAVEGAGAADRCDPSSEVSEPAEVEQVGANERAERAGYVSDRGGGGSREDQRGGGREQRRNERWDGDP